MEGTLVPLTLMSWEVAALNPRPAYTRGSPQSPPKKGRILSMTPVSGFVPRQKKTRPHRSSRVWDAVRSAVVLKLNLHGDWDRIVFWDSWKVWD